MESYRLPVLQLNELAYLRNLVWSKESLGLLVAAALHFLRVKYLIFSKVAQTQWLYVIGVESPLKNVLHFPHAGNGRTAVILQTTVEQPSDQIDFCFFRNSRIVYVQEQALRPALIHGMLDANKVSFPRGALLIASTCR